MVWMFRAALPAPDFKAASSVAGVGGEVVVVGLDSGQFWSH